MDYILPEGLKKYLDIYHGQFSRKLAEWAIGKMKAKKNVGNPGDLVAVKVVPIEAVMEALKGAGVHVDEECVYTAWYLWHMAIADYPRALDSDARRAWYIDETLNDPDGKQGDVLACFWAKCNNAGVAVLWERMI